MKRIYLFIIPALLIVVSSYTFIQFGNGIFGSDISVDEERYASPKDRECSFCHNDIIKHEFPHAPVLDDCQTCHQTTGNKHPRAKLKGFILVEKMPDLCHICHEVQNDKNHVHSPVNSGDCNSCHDPHGSKYQYYSPKPSPTELCKECHDLEFDEKPIIHAAIELDGCNTCHDSHQSDHEALLTEEKLDLCMTCHDNISTDKKAKYQHVPFDDCNNCHNSHNTKYEHLLTASKEELCFTCHDDIGLKDSKYIHPVVDDEKGCANCHSPHASDFEKILKEDQSELCFSCHNENSQSTNIEKKVKGSKYIHAPVESGCNECHDPHASNNYAILKDAYPKGIYISAEAENFTLCFNCHDPSLLNEKDFETNFKNGDSNLHFVHMNGPKSRNCSVCHDPHATGNLHLIKERSLFGNWDMPMNYVPTETGGSCRTGCHTDKKYIR